MNERVERNSDDTLEFSTVVLTHSDWDVGGIPLPPDDVSTECVAFVVLI